MAIYPKPELAALYQVMFKEVRKIVVEERGTYVIDSRHRNPHYLAVKIRYALASADEWPEEAPDGRGLKELVIVRPKMKEHEVWIMPRGEPVPARGRRWEEVYEKPISGVGREFKYDDEVLAFFLNGLRQGVGVFEDVNIPNTENARQVLNVRLRNVGFEIVEYDPPKRVVFRSIND